MSFLTTADNPYNPNEDLEKWLVFDISRGYDTCGVLARNVKIKPGSTEQEQNQATEEAIDRLIAADPLNFYRKISITA